MSIGLNHLIIDGNVTRDPQVRLLANDRSVASFSIANNRRCSASTASSCSRCPRDTWACGAAGTDGVGTWAMQKMGSPRPIGGCWLRFYAPDSHSIAWEVTPTQVDYANISDYLRGKKRIVREAEPSFE